MKPTKPKHTSESIIISADLGPSGREYFVNLPNGEMIGSKFCLSAKSAKLIAAAPEMLEALEDCLNYFNYAEESEAYEFAKEVRALIHKAKGGAE